MIELRKLSSEKNLVVFPLLHGPLGEDGTIQGGETLVITAVGAGLTWGGAALKLGTRVTPLDKTDAELPPYEGTGLDVIRESINYFVPEKAEK